MAEVRRDAGDVRSALRPAPMEAHEEAGARGTVLILRTRWDTLPPTFEFRTWDGWKFRLPVGDGALAQEVQRHLRAPRPPRGSGARSPDSVQALMELRARAVSPAALRSLFSAERWERITRSPATYALMQRLATAGPGAAPSAAEAAMRAGLPGRTFRRRFAAVAGFSYRTLIVRFRVAVARGVGELHHAAIEDSARAVGYGFGSSASQAAVRATGRTLGGRKPCRRASGTGSPAR